MSSQSRSERSVCFLVTKGAEGEYCILHLDDIMELTIRRYWEARLEKTTDNGVFKGVC